MTIVNTCVNWIYQLREANTELTEVNIAVLALLGLLYM